MMPNGDPQDGFFYTTLTLMIDSYNLRTKYTKFQLKIPIFFGYVKNLPRVSKLLPILLWNDRERNGTFTRMSEALWKIFQ